MRFLVTILFAALAFGQTAKYPGMVATTQDLLKQKDRSASVLTAGIDAETLTVPVADGTRFVAYEILTIDDEQMQVESIDGNTLTIVAGTRGWDWTVPATHNEGAAVRGQVTAYHHNALIAEVIALEKHGAPVFNVKGYGAVCDETADDKAAIQAAIDAAYTAGGGKVVLCNKHKVSGTLDVKKNVTVEGFGTSMTGTSEGGTRILFTSADTPLFRMWTDHSAVRGMRLVQSGTPVAGNAAISTLAGGGGGDANGPRFENLEIEGFYDGAIVDGSCCAIVTGVTVQFAVHDGIVNKGGGGYWSKVDARFNGGHGFYLTTGTYATGVPFFESITTYCNHGWGVYAEGGTLIRNGFINNDWLGGVYVNYPGAGGDDGGTIANVEIQYSGDPTALCPASAGSLTAQGIHIAGEPIRLINNQVYYSQGNGIELTGAGGNGLVTGNHVYGNGAGGQAGDVYALKVTNTLNAITGNRLSGPSVFSGGQNNITGNIITGASALPLLYFPAGTDYILANNWINQGGAGTAITADGGTTFLPAVNKVVAGAVTMNGTFDGTPWDLVRLSGAQTITGRKDVVFSSVADFLATWQNLSATGYSGVLLNNETGASVGMFGYDNDTATNRWFGYTGHDILLDNQGGGKLRVTAAGTTTTGDSTVSGLAGEGNAYACVDANGKLYRSATVCVE